MRSCTLAKVTVLAISIALWSASQLAGSVQSCKAHTVGSLCLGPIGISGGLTGGISCVPSVALFVNTPASVVVAASGSNPPFTYSIIAAVIPSGFQTSTTAVGFPIVTEFIAGLILNISGYFAP